MRWINVVEMVLPCIVSMTFDIEFSKRNWPIVWNVDAFHPTM